MPARAPRRSTSGTRLPRRARRRSEPLPATAERRAATGRLFAGTSGFAYPGWAPTFYTPGLRASGFLREYASRLRACELNNTFYRQPTPSSIAGWLAATDDDFRFAVKAQRGGAFRAMTADPEATVPWLTAPLAGFGARLGAVLFRVPDTTPRDDARLDALLRAWPPAVRLTMEFQHPSWHVDEVFARLAASHATLCATELPGDDGPPTIRVTGDFLYVRLRREAYTPAEVEEWADRLVPFLEAGHDAYVFFRHDEAGDSALQAVELDRLVGARLGLAPA